MSYLHDVVTQVPFHDRVIFYEDLSVAVVFTMWAYDWLREKRLKLKRKNSARRSRWKRFLLRRRRVRVAK